MSDSRIAAVGNRAAGRAHLEVSRTLPQIARAPRRYDAPARVARRRAGGDGIDVPLDAERTGACCGARRLRRASRCGSNADRRSAHCPRGFELHVLLCRLSWRQWRRERRRACAAARGPQRRRARAADLGAAASDSHRPERGYRQAPARARAVECRADRGNRRVSRESRAATGRGALINWRTPPAAVLRTLPAFPAPNGAPVAAGAERAAWL